MICSGVGDRMEGEMWWGWGGWRVRCGGEGGGVDLLVMSLLL